MCIEGGEGVGKSSLAFHIATDLDPNFHVGKIVFDFDDFKSAVKKSKKGDVILVDEGALVLFKRDAMKGDVKDMIKLFTAIRQYNLIIIICVPRFEIIDSYLRDYRVKCLIKLTMRGRYAVYNRSKIKQIHRHKKFGRWVYPTPNFKESFPKFTGDIWKDYLKKKGKVLDNSTTKFMGVSEFAKKNKVHPMTIRNRIKDNKIKYELTSTGRYRIPSDQKI